MLSGIYLKIYRPEMLRTFRRRMADKVIERDATLQWKLRSQEQETNRV